MTVKEVLIAARKRIEKEENWCKGSAATDANGVIAPYEVATRFCLFGAVEAAGGTPIRDGVWESLKEACLPWYGPIGYNDATETTHADVLTVMDKAIASCE